MVEALQLAQSSGNAAEGSDSPFFPPSLRVPKYTLMPCFHCQAPSDVSSVISLGQRCYPCNCRALLLTEGAVTAQSLYVA